MFNQQIINAHEALSFFASHSLNDYYIGSFETDIYIKPKNLYTKWLHRIVCFLGFRTAYDSTGFTGATKKIIDLINRDYTSERNQFKIQLIEQAKKLKVNLSIFDDLNCKEIEREVIAKSKILRAANEEISTIIKPDGLDHDFIRQTRDLSSIVQNEHSLHHILVRAQQSMIDLKKYVMGATETLSIPFPKKLTLISSDDLKGFVDGRLLVAELFALAIQSDREKIAQIQDIVNLIAQETDFILKTKIKINTIIGSSKPELQKEARIVIGAWANAKVEELRSLRLNHASGIEAHDSLIGILKKCHRFRAEIEKRNKAI